MNITLSLLAFAQIAMSSPVENWPTARPVKVISTPDWSDYKIYPMAARRKNQEGRVLPDLLIGTDGRAQTCRILESSGHPELDTGTCQLMMQMLFESPRDEDGNPIPSHYSRPIIWLLTEPRAFASSRLTTKVRIKNHRLVECTVADGEGPYLAPWAALACSLYKDVGYFFGPRAGESLSANIAVHLDAGDHAPLLGQPWPTGQMIAHEKISFTINGSGDATQCVADESQGLGPRDLNNLSPCDRLLSSLWFKRATGKHGSFETQVLMTESDH